MIGSFIGRRGGVVDKNVVLTNLVDDLMSVEDIAQGRFRESIATDAAKLAGFTGIGTGVFTYDAEDDSFGIECCSEFDETFTPAMRTVSADNRFLVHDDGAGNRLLVYRPGPDNPEINLTYVSLAMFERTTDFSGMDTRQIDRYYMPWGIKPPALPTTGSASYSGIVIGTGIGDAANYEVGGTITLSTDFSNLTGTLDLSGVNRFGGASVDFGEHEFVTTVHTSTGTFSGEIDPDGISGFIQGTFFGYHAQEIGGAFGGLVVGDPGNIGQTVEIFGGFAGKKN